MARSLIPDPLALLREAVNHLEAGANSLAHRKIANSQELAKTLQRLGTVSLGAQRVMEKALAAFYARLDIPSRTELASVAASVQRIEDKLDLLLPATSRSSLAARPARTRRPPPSVVQAPASVAPAKKTPPRAAAKRVGARR
jgi:hypothetical protein